MKRLFRNIPPDSCVKKAVDVRDVFAPMPLEEYPPYMRAHIERLRKVLKRRAMISRILSVLAWTSRGIVAVGAAYLLALATDRTPPVTAIFAAVNNDVPPGGHFMLRIALFRDRSCESKTTYRIYDGAGTLIQTIDLPWILNPGPNGADVPFNRDFIIPKDAKPGIARIRIDNAWRCAGNPFHETWPILSAFPDVSFTITPR